MSTELARQLLLTFKLITADPSTGDLEEGIQLGQDLANSGANISQIMEAIGATPYEQQEIMWTLEDQASEIKQSLEDSSKAELISNLLPHVEGLLASWDSEEAPGHGLKDHENPIHQLQEALGMPSHDGEWGLDTFIALVEYEVEGLKFGFAGNHTIDTRQFSEISSLDSSEARNTRSIRNSAWQISIEQKALEQQIADQAETHNEFISDEFELCTGEAIDLSQENPFADILQEIGPFAQLADEQHIAHERVAEAIKTACGRYLDQIQDDDVKVGLIERLATGLEPKVNEAVTKAATAANVAIVQRAVEAGRAMERENPNP